MISDDFQIGPNGAYEHVGSELDLQYQDLLQTILDFGVEKTDRTGTGTKSIFGYTIRHNMKDGFPLLTTKKMAWRTIVTELLWFLRGDTNIKYLVDNNCHIWDGDAYKAYQRGFKEKHYLKPTSTKEEFINKIKTDDEFANKWGELGPVYGKQWRNWRKFHYDSYDEDQGISTDVECSITYIDQIANLISELKTNPDSRRLMVNAWNVGELDQMVLPPCHYGFQVYTRELSLEERKVIAKKVLPILNTFLGNQSEEGWIEQCEKLNIPTRAISLMWNQRSVDTFLGLPFNIASYGLLLELIAKAVNMIPDELIGNLGDVHLYNNHIEQAKEQISRTPYELPKLNINIEFWPTENGSCGEGPLDATAVFNSFKKDDFCKCLLEEDIQLTNYESHPAIKAPLSN
jgi:thymidylate synthase